MKFPPQTLPWPSSQEAYPCRDAARSARTGIRLVQAQKSAVGLAREACARSLFGGATKRETGLYHYNILHGALKQAVKMGYVARNVADAVDPPRARRLVVATMAREDVPRFLAAAKGTFYYLLFYTALYTGMRLGELQCGSPSGLYQHFVRMCTYQCQVLSC